MAQAGNATSANANGATVLGNGSSALAGNPGSHYHVAVVGNGKTKQKP